MGIDDTRYIKYRLCMIETFDDVFAAFGGAPKLGEAIGIKDFHAQTMKARKSIPAAYWQRVVDAAAAIGKPEINYEKLAELAEKRARAVEPEARAS